jgi:2-keto-4-pentenoate hydratase/2-oxohepta-3-ene-1,7-dioic acid hydratase in catechol pathway
MKHENAYLSGDKPFVYEEHYVNIVHELELVYKICKKGKNIKVEDASKYYDEVTVGIDLTDRGKQTDLKKAGHPWEIAKAFDHSAVVGKFMPLLDAQNTNETITFRMDCNEKILQ